MKPHKHKSNKAKHKISTVLAAALLLGSASTIAWTPGVNTVAAAAQTLQVVSQPFVIDGIKSTVPTANVDGNTYISIRALNDKLGLATSFDSNTKAVTIQGRDRVFTANSKDGSYELNGQLIYGNPAILQNGSAYMPLRFILERMGYGITYDAASRSVGIQTLTENKLAIETKTISNHTAGQSLLIQYPVITGYENPETEYKMNTYLKKEAEAYAASGQHAIAEASASNDELGAADKDTTIPDATYQSYYTVTYNEQNQLSLYIDYYLYTGGAHGMTERVPYTFDLSSGDVVTLKEAANSNPNYVAIINAAIRNQIKTRNLNLLSPFEGIAGDRPFYLKHDAVIIAFGQYEYTPYAEGIPEFAITFEAFKK
ncbi:hypothetical protein FHS15_003345 [Paenibacillus castaneae]|uniref:PdaC/SigV domain-containing protein n=1 Tax=Paenibacillus castaneae TaxID=474957 RepID=UPI00141B87EB|nr:DUF4163 domain-containing protein [Paenibacillus castaneae]NIK78207.1 hypothetical protein [Paenibacillus castaneae]